MKNTNNYLQDVDKDWAVNNPEKYYGIALVAVEESHYVLQYVNRDWALENPKWYYDIALAAVKKSRYALQCVNEDWVFANPTQYYDIALAAMENGYALRFVDKNWASNNPELYKEIALEAVSQNGMALEFASDDLKNNYDIVMKAVQQNGIALYAVNDMILSSTQYYDIVLEAVSQNGIALDFASEELRNNQKIVLAALSQDESALQYAGEIFRNNTKLIISSLINLDRKYSYGQIMRMNKIDKILGSKGKARNDILIYIYILSNKNVSNKFKNALFEVFRDKFDQSSDKFTLYKNILECYLVLSEGYTKDFPNHKLLAKLRKDDSKQLHMFLSLADPSALKNTQLAKLLNNDHNDHNDIIKNYLAEDTYHLKYIKNLNNIYGWLSKNCCVLDYTKIINMINPHQMKLDTEFYPMRNDLIRLVLCYLKIEDLLALDKELLQYFTLPPRAKLKGKYLEDIDLKFFGPEGYASTGIEALVDAIKSNNGSLRNKGEDSNFNNTIYFLDDCLHKDYIELK